MAFFSPLGKSNASVAAAVWGCFICIVIGAKFQMAAAIPDKPRYSTKKDLRGIALKWPENMADEKQKLSVDDVLPGEIKEVIYQLAPDAEAAFDQELNVDAYPEDTPLYQDIKARLADPTLPTTEIRLYPTYDAGVSITDPEQNYRHFGRLLSLCKKHIDTKKFTNAFGNRMFYDEAMTRNIRNGMPSNLGIVFKTRISEGDLKEAPDSSSQSWFHVALRKDKKRKLRIDITYHPTFDPEKKTATKRLLFSGQYHQKSTGFKPFQTVHIYHDKDFGNNSRQWTAQTTITQTFDEDGELLTVNDTRCLHRHGFRRQNPEEVVAIYWSEDFLDTKTGTETMTERHWICVDKNEEFTGPRKFFLEKKKKGGEATEFQMRRIKRLEDEKTVTAYFEQYNPSKTIATVTSGIFMYETDYERETADCMPRKEDIFAVGVTHELAGTKGDRDLKRVARAAFTQLDDETTFALVSESDRKKYPYEEFAYDTEKPLTNEKLQNFLSFNAKENAQNRFEKSRAAAAAQNAATATAAKSKKPPLGLSQKKDWVKAAKKELELCLDGLVDLSKKKEMSLEEKIKLREEKKRELSVCMSELAESAKKTEWQEPEEKKGLREAKKTEWQEPEEEKEKREAKKREWDMCMKEIADLASRKDLGPEEERSLEQAKAKFLQFAKDKLQEVDKQRKLMQQEHSKEEQKQKQSETEKKQKQSEVEKKQQKSETEKKQQTSEPEEKKKPAPATKKRSEQEERERLELARKEESELASMLGDSMLAPNARESAQNTLISRPLMFGGFLLAAILMTSCFLAAKLRRPRRRLTQKTFLGLLAN